MPLLTRTSQADRSNVENKVEFGEESIREAFRRKDTFNYDSLNTPEERNKPFKEDHKLHKGTCNTWIVLPPNPLEPTWKGRIPTNCRKLIPLEYSHLYAVSSLNTNSRYFVDRRVSLSDRTASDSSKIWDGTWEKSTKHTNRLCKTCMRSISW